MVGQSEFRVCADVGARTPIGASGNSHTNLIGLVHLSLNNSPLSLGLKIVSLSFNMAIEDKVSVWTK